MQHCWGAELLHVLTALCMQEGPSHETGSPVNLNVTTQPHSALSTIAPDHGWPAVEVTMNDILCAHTLPCTAHYFVRLQSVHHRASCTCMASLI